MTPKTRRPTDLLEVPNMVLHPKAMVLRNRVLMASHLRDKASMGPHHPASITPSNRDNTDLPSREAIHHNKVDTRLSRVATHPSSKAVTLLSKVDIPPSKVIPLKVVDIRNLATLVAMSCSG